MAQLQKMIIQGIRSFGPDDEDRQLVSFYTPLTLILGQNGCGKTTIIEALRYALTGDLPPGAKQGHSFVFDPKLARQTEVLGKVQLKLRDAKGKEMAVTRCVQVSQKKATLQFKTLDASISRAGADGEKIQISGRCVDVDLEMATSMGVSKSVLNNVILCHQEETSWPLDEGKKLKDRFDAIFDTVKHNKCLVQLTDLRKAIKSEISHLKIDLNHMKDKKDAAFRLQEEIKDIENSLNVAQDQLDKFETRKKPLKERLHEIESQESDVVALYSKQEKLKTEITYLRSEQNDLKKRLSNPFTGSVEDLNDKLNRFQSVMRTKGAECRDLKERKVNTKKEEEKLLEDMSLKQKKIGQLETQQQMYDKNVDERNRLLEKLHQTLVMESVTITETNVRSVIDNVEQKLRDKEELLEQLQQDQRGEEQVLQNKVDTLRDAKVKKEEEVKMKKQQIDKNNTSIRKIQKDIEEMESAANRLADVERQLTEVKANLEVVAEEVNVEEQNDDIKRYEDDEQRVNLELEKVDKVVQELQKHSVTRTRLTVKQQEQKDKMAEFSRLKNKNGDTLKHLLGSIPEIGLKKKFDVCLEQIVQDLNTKNSELRKIQTEISKIEVNRRHKKEQLNTKEKELKEDEEKLYEYCEDRDLEDVISSLDDDIQKLRSTKGELASQKVLYEKYVQKLEETDPCCPLCHRDFQRADEASILVDELRNEVRNVPMKLRENEESLKRLVKRYDTLLQLRSTYERMKNSKEIQVPKLRKELREVENQLKSSREEAENLQNDLLTPQMDEGMARGMQADIIVMDKCQSELKLIDAEISKFQKDLPSHVSERSLEDSMALQNDLRKEVADLREKIKTEKQLLENHKNKLQKLHERKNTLVEEQLRIQAGTQQLQQFQQKLRELEDSNGDLEEQVQILKSDVTVTSNDYENVRRALSDMKSEHNSQIREKREAVMSWKSKYQEIKKLIQSIADYERRGTNGELRVARQDLAEMERGKKDLQTRLKDLSDRVDKLTEEINGQKTYERELKDNQLLFEKESEEEKLVEEQANLQKKIGSSNYEQLVAQKRKIELELQAIVRESLQVGGRVDELKKRLKNQQNEYAQDMYQNAGKKYSRAQREKIVKEIVENDLAKYQKAMEWTMTQFHQERMKAINEIIHDLWRSIYRGNDIDFIKIDANSPDLTSDTTKRRSYDYKVVQVKNDVEIDMRGRCSAGQKVLACLIIRIALAETLSSQCGILALDEPTTNLDRENIESLAEALVQVVNTRMINKGFQLIVITHDEEFVSHMRQVAGLNYYHVVSRNEEGKSRIQKHALNGRK